MKVLIVRLVTAGCLTFLTVFCTVYVMGSLRSNTPTSEGQTVEAANASVATDSPTQPVAHLSDASVTGEQLRPTSTKDIPGSNQSNPATRPDDNWLLGTAAQRKRFQPLMRSKLAPAIDVGPWTNTPPLPANFRDGKIVVLTFWSTWSEPCLESINFNNSVHLNYRDQGVLLLGICNTDGSENMSRVVKSKQIAYPVAIDQPDDKSLTAYQVQALPTYFVIGRDGRLRFADIDRNHLNDAIQLLLNENSAATQHDAAGN